MAAAAFFFSIMSMLVKYAGSLGFPSQTLVLARAVVTLVLSIAWLRIAGISMLGNRKSLLLLRGTTGTIALMCFYYAITTLSLADATIIQYTNPLMTALLAALVLAERIERWQLAGATISIAGIVLVARPAWIFGAGTEHLPLVPVLVASVGAVLSAISYVAVRELRKTDHPMVIIAWFPFIAVPAVLPFVIADLRIPVGWEWLLLIGIGVATQLGQIFLTWALHNESAGKATGISYLQIAFAFVWGIVLFGESVRWTSLAGAILIAGGTIGMGWWTGRSARRHSPENETESA
jgi:drug/metabolite transporter (DMT)-like permease